jgi:hypothetical protein
LRQLYQDDQSFTLEPASPGVRVVVEIPYSEAPRRDEAFA